MYQKGIDLSRETVSAVKTAALTTACCLALLIPISLLLWHGILSMDTVRYISLAALFLSAWLVSSCAGADSGEGPLSILLAGAVLYMLLLLLSAGMKGSEVAPGKTAVAALAGLWGFALGSMKKINKKYTRKRSRKKKYNK